MSRASSPKEAGGLPEAVTLPRHAGLVLMSDFLGPLDDIKRLVTGFAGQHVRGHLLQILDPAEETLPYDGRVRFDGLEHEPSTLISRVETIRDQYQEKLAAQRDGLASIAKLYGWSFATHRTDHPPHLALLALFGAMSAFRASPHGQRAEAVLGL